jgi:hypothetical protein
VQEEEEPRKDQERPADKRAAPAMARCGLEDVDRSS